MKKLIITTILIASVLLSPDMKAGKRAFIAEKNFPLVVALGDFADRQAELSDLSLRRFEAVRSAEGQAWLDSIQFSEKDIETISKAVTTKGLSFAKEMKASGKYYIYNNLSDKEFLKAALRQDIEGINRVVRVYAQGERPYYASIDSISFDRGPKSSIHSILKDLKAAALKESAAGDIFSLPMCVALSLLESNDRQDAAAFEPMEEGINREAFLAAGKTDWKKYEYTAILVPGSGPDIADQPLSPTGRQRVRYAAVLYKEGKAPFIIVSGGSVHPRLTTFNEADQMRKYLIEECGVPASAIIAEPHARHTTTNMRNAARLMLKYGFPLDRPALVASSEGQVNYIGRESFSNLCLKLMQVLPFRLERRINANEQEFFPLPCAAQVSPVDPMDP